MFDPARRGNACTRLMVLLSVVIWAPSIAAQTIEARLARGGLVLAFSAPEAEADGLAARSDADCRVPRSLSRTGQRDAKALGDAFRNTEAQFDQVLAGPACRVRHTAFLAIGADWVQYRDALSAPCATGSATGALRPWLEREPAPGRNHLVFTRACLLRADLARFDTICAQPPQPGDAVVYDPARDGEPIACITLQRWRDWAKAPHWSQRLQPASRFPFRRFD